jgi:hypothetical protein
MNLKSKVKLAARAISNSLSSEDQGVEATDILDTLKKEHDEVKDLLKKHSDAETAAQRRTLVLKIKASLVPHTKAEEKVGGLRRSNCTSGQGCADGRARRLSRA